MVDKMAIIKACGVTSKKTDKGIEIFVDKKKKGTLVSFEGGVRLIYPRGSECKHTSMWGCELNDAFVQKMMFSYACEEIDDLR